MRILVTGAGGMLARDIIAQVPAAETVIPLDRKALDVTDARATRARITAARPDCVVHCAAYSRVDQAEAEPDNAHAVNASGTLNVALAARDVGARLLYVSTDYVFSGKTSRPWREDDPTEPVNVYGKSKLAGERAVREVLPDRYLIVRTQWLFGAGGRNFISAILRRAAEGASLRVVSDQVGAPTYTGDVASAMLRLVADDARGTYHVANAGSASWLDLAHYVLQRTGTEADLRSCTTEEAARPAARPAFSVLDCSRFVSRGGAPLRVWQDAVDAFLCRRHS